MAATVLSHGPKNGGKNTRASSPIKEGFLCPICLQDLHSFHNLQNHFEAAHSSEDKAVMSQIKGLFTKAKDRFLGREYETNDPRNPFNDVAVPRTSSTLSDIDPALWEPQEIGVSRCKMDKFKVLRDARIDRVVIETNKILIRLEKLTKPVKLFGKPNERGFEQSLVPWVPDEDVPYCPTCGDKFNVARRKHHCRLCGAIMCTKCSIFLPFAVAEELLVTLNSSTQTPKLKKNPSHLQNIPSAENSEEVSVRICFECDKVLQRNKEKLERKHSPTLLVKLYDKMFKAMEDSKHFAPEYQKMAESLNNGEEEFKLDVATEKRFQLMQMFEAIDVLSKKIAVLDTEDEENPISPAALRLQTAIRRSAYTFLQENMLSLPSLPSQPKLNVLQAKRRAEIEKRLREQRQEAQRLREEERRRKQIEKLQKEREAAEAARKAEMQAPFVNHLTTEERPSLLKLDPGWSADTISLASNSSRHGRRRSYDSDESDGSSTRGSREDSLGPLLDQIEYVRESAKQARAAGMKAEAESLERNMEELKLEYRKQQTALAFAVTPSTPDNNLESPMKGFTPSSNNLKDTGEDPLLQQIKYIARCIDEARAKNKMDEARMLAENLEELKLIYKQSRN